MPQQIRMACMSAYECSNIKLNHASQECGSIKEAGAMAAPARPHNRHHKTCAGPGTATPEGPMKGSRSRIPYADALSEATLFASPLGSYCATYWAKPALLTRRCARTPLDQQDLVPVFPHIVERVADDTQGNRHVQGACEDEHPHRHLGATRRHMETPQQHILSRSYKGLMWMNYGPTACRAIRSKSVSARC